MRWETLWYGSHPLSIILAPLGWLYEAVAAMRRHAYRVGWLQSEKLPVPVIVVGNITVGGTGKTPLVIWLVETLRRRGLRPGVISRGYGGTATTWPLAVEGGSDPAVVGDEPLLIAQRCACPVVVDPQRPRGARKLIDDHGCDVIVSDDGLQHYALKRDVEIAVVDGVRRFGNGRCLPAGPLREGVGRLQSVDLMVINGAAASHECAMILQGDHLQSLRDADINHSLDQWRGKRVHGVAGIGHPQRFFTHLRALGLEVIEHPFPDHHRFVAQDLHFDDGLPVVMTEKDAVKCRAYAAEQSWYVPVRANLNDACQRRLEGLLEDRLGKVENRPTEVQ